MFYLFAFYFIFDFFRYARAYVRTGCYAPDQHNAILSLKTRTSFRLNCQNEHTTLTLQTAIAGCYYIPNIFCQQKLITTKLETCSYSYIQKDMSKN